MAATQISSDHLVEPEPIQLLARTMTTNDGIKLYIPPIPIPGFEHLAKQAVRNTSDSHTCIGGRDDGNYYVVSPKDSSKGPTNMRKDTFSEK
jgi:hypothetical protein